MMDLKLLVFLGLFCLVNRVFSQVISLGNCPQVEVQQNFNLQRYLGKWYENRRYFNWFSFLSNCVTAEYTLLTETSVLVNNTGFLNHTDEFTTAIGNARIEDSGKLGVRFSEFAPWGKYWILSTDYSSYSVVWSCDETPRGPIQFNSQYLWLLTRSPEGVSESKVEEVMTILKDYRINIDPTKFKITRQVGCPGRHMASNM